MANLLHRYKSFPLLLAVAVSLAGYRSAMAQDPRADSLSDAFNRYPMRWVQEKLFVHIDKTFYLAGEFIWFKAYDVDSRGNMPLSISGVAYVELLDKDQKPVLQEKIALKNGAGHGSFRIPSSIVPGHYIFRAYTGWMKNFSPDLYYHQSLTILNTLNNEAPDTARQHADAADAGYAIRFFPEGGSLVDGLVSEVGFKATDRSDNGMPCSGVVVDQRKDTVARFTANRFGMGHFTFTPLPGNTYTALVTAAPGKASESLPAALEQGIVLHLEDIDAHRLRVSVHSTAALPDPSLYLFVHTRHHIRSILVNRLAGNQASFLIDKDSLDNGISHITLFTAERTPVCERLYCKQPERRLRIDVKPAGTTGTTGPRSKLTVELSTTDPSGRPLPADLSMSVFLVDPLQPVPEENILSYLLLRSDLRGRIQSPGSYFGDSGRATREALDDLMLTQGWSRFRWDDILHDKKPAFEFLPEPNGPVVHARLVDRTTGRPAAPQTAYLSIPGRRFRLSAALSRADGSVNFDVGKFYGARELILQTNSPAGGDSDIRIDVSGPFSDRFAQPSDDAGAAGALPPQTTRALLNRSIAVQAENAYRVGEKYRVLPDPGNDTLGFYGVADRRYNLDDYTRFVTMDEVIREFVDNVKSRSQSGKTIFRVRNALFNTFFGDDPLVLVDGVPVFSGEKVLALNPLRIEKIDVVSHRYYLGPSVTDGIISLRSYDGDLGGYQLDPGAVVVPYNGLQEDREFYTPVYESAAQVQSPIPDLRNQLLWRPDISTDTTGGKSIPLYTSDMTGTFAIVVEGLSRDGLAGYAIKMFSVRSSAQTGTLVQ